MLRQAISIKRRTHMWQRRWQDTHCPEQESLATLGVWNRWSIRHVWDSASRHCRSHTVLVDSCCLPHHRGRLVAPYNFSWSSTCLLSPIQKSRANARASWSARRSGRWRTKPIKYRDSDRMSLADVGIRNQWLAMTAKICWMCWHYPLFGCDPGGTVHIAT